MYKLIFTTFALLAQGAIHPRQIQHIAVTKTETYVPEIVLVEGGVFQMGCNYGEIDETPPHKVRLSTFYIGRYEVTNAEFCAFLNIRRSPKKDVDSWIVTTNQEGDIYREGNSYVVKEGRENYPVTLVSWFGTSAYCEFLRDVTGEPFRLPTEAEWEYASKGGKKTHHYVYSGSHDVGEVAWFDWNADGFKHPVGMLKPNELMIYDMCGNVQEWCNDWYDTHYYEDSDVENPTGPETGFECVARGGAFSLGLEYTRNEDRNKFKPTTLNITLGFRVAKDYLK
jgi:formylglycine-generating enzyme required for sulfatase activity